MRFEEIKMDEVMEVNGGTSVKTLFPPNVVIEAVLKKMGVGAAVAAVALSVISKIR